MLHSCACSGILSTEQRSHIFRCHVQPQPEKGFINLTAFYVIPNGSQKSTVLFNGYFSEKGYKTLPPPARGGVRLRPQWAPPQVGHNVFDCRR